MKNTGDLHLAFDVGHSSIGWAVLRQDPSLRPPAPEILGTGVVTFGADDCLAVKRRKNRQARRHARATRQRIAHMEKLLAHLGVMSVDELKARHDQGCGDSFSWQKAADILAAARTGRPVPQTAWPELWEILRWYAHNRGYFAPPWANRGDDTAEDSGDDVPDTEKVANSHSIMTEFSTQTMAEAIAAYTEWYEKEIVKWRAGGRSNKPPHFKGLSAAFRRESVVWPEVFALLIALKGRLPKLNNDAIRTILGSTPDPMADPEAWKTVPCEAIKLPKRYMGGLVFGQMIPRFDNRIIGVCPILFARRQAELIDDDYSAEEAKHEAEKESKLPAKATPEFLRFRWAMQLANVFGARDGDKATRPLTGEERKALTALVADAGAMTKSVFKKAIRELTGWKRDNLESMLIHPDAERALVLDPVQSEIRKSVLVDALNQMPDRFRKRLNGKLARGKTVCLQEIRNWLEGDDGARFDAEVNRLLTSANTRKSKKQTATTRESLLQEKLLAQFPSGRAPYSRPILRQAFDEVMNGWDPRAEKNDQQARGCLCQTEELKEAQLLRRLEEQTNNHLVRHRLLILGGEQPRPGSTPEQERRRFKGLLHDLVQEFAKGDTSRIAGMTIEVNRDLQAQSGKTRKEQEQDLGRRMGDFKTVAAKVEEACKRRGMPITAGLIRKARVAEDFGWKCPYTGKAFDIDSLLDGTMDKEHIIPHADRQSDSLDSLVITWTEVNKWKGKRTAMEFIRDEGGKTVPGRPELTIMTLGEFKKFVDGLNTRKGHNDDQARKKRRVSRLLTEHYEEKEFTPRDLTVTSHLVRLGAQVLQRSFPADQRPPVVSLPGSVTGEVRKAWRLIGCLGAANPAIFQADGRTPKTKQEIRGITHLHHALDACVLGLASIYFPRNGELWKAMIQRRPDPGQQSLLRSTNLYRSDSEGRMRLDELPDGLKKQLREKLAEKRVVQHIPADMSGVKVEENTRGVVQQQDGGRVVLRQQAPRDTKTGVRPETKETEEAAGKLLGLEPTTGAGKLKNQKGVRVITDNYGVAILDHTADEEDKFEIIPWHRVWKRLDALRERNGGKPPRVLRIGSIVQVPSKSGRADYRGLWMIRGAQINQRQGFLVDISAPDVITYRVSGRSDCFQNVRLKALVDGGLQILKPTLAGLSLKT